MPISLLLLFPFILLSISSLSSPSQLDHEFIYTGFSDPNTNVTLDGVAQVNKNGLLRLTNHTSRLMGHAFYPTPLHFKNSSNGYVSSFSTSFAFAIVPEYKKLGGHGLAFAISPSKDFTKSALPSQYLGLLNATDVGNFSNHLFAVEFDTVQDFEFGDINDNHVGIDINSLKSNKSAKATYFPVDSSAKQDLNIKSGKTIMAWIEYDSSVNFINVTISPSATKPRLPILSYKLNLSPFFQDKMYVGFSASTGLLASSHYILGWSFKMNGDAQSLDLDSLPSIPETRKQHLHTGLIISVCVSAVVFALAIAGVIYLTIKKIRNADVIEPWEMDIGPKRYSYQEIKKATRNFRESELLGFGGFGQVYKGTLKNSRTQVAVKRISHESNQGIREFVSEISSIGKLRHRNLVQLVGWCRKMGDLLLVYEFMPNGSLDRFLFDEPKSVLSWEQRVNIIKGMASGLLYLHEGYEQIVIHRDIKASNVLLDGDLNGKLGDFGLARLCEHGENPGTTRVVGTLGYLAPELARTGRATTQSDVFAFGALLLEVSCGRRPIEPKAMAPNELVLVDWVWEKWMEGQVLDVVDPRLNGEFDEGEMIAVIKLGLMCSNNVATARPSMRWVVRCLEGEVKVPEVFRPPGGRNDGKGYEEEGFDSYLDSYRSSCEFEKGSSNLLGANGDGGDGDGDGNVSFASVSRSSLSLLCNRRETR